MVTAAEVRPRARSTLAVGLGGVIVVIGSPVLHRDPDSAVAEIGGLAGRIALVAAAANRRVQLVAKLGDDDAGDAVLLALTGAGVGHAAVLRDASHATPVIVAAAQPADEDPFPADEPSGPPPVGLALEAGDVQLALRYLTDFQVVVIAVPLDAGTLATAIEAAGFAGATPDPAGRGRFGRRSPVWSRAVTAFEAPADAEPAFATMVGQYAAGLDAGRDPRVAFLVRRRREWESAPATERPRAGETRRLRGASRAAR